MKNLRLLTSTTTIIIAFALFQLHHLLRHPHINASSDSRLTAANPYLFSQHFALLPLSRTLKHEKGIDYWFDWLQHEAAFISFHKVITLLHFDVHAIEDNSDEIEHICSAANLFTYDFFVQQTLEDAYNAYFEEKDEEETANVTRRALQTGYMKEVVWIFPDRWLNHRDPSLLSLRKLIYHQTFFVNPTEQKVLYLHNAAIDEQQQLWNKLFDPKKQVFLPVYSALNVSSFDHLEINIWVLSLSQYLNEPHFVAQSALSRHLILDFDLDFFHCQEPAQTFLKHFDWTPQITDRFNEILQHHQYVPSHMFSEYSNEAIVTLLHELNENKHDETESQQLIKAEIKAFPAPKIEDVFEIALQEQMEIETIERALYLLYEYQLERMQYEPQCAQHLTHFDDVFQILQRAHRRLADMDGEVIGYQDSEQTPKLRKSTHSRHWKHLRDIAMRREKLEHFQLEKRETQEIKKLNENSQDTLREFDEFADKLVRLHEQRKRLMSAEIDELGEQKEVKKEEEMQATRTDVEPERVHQTEWSDQQLKDLMNMTSDYLYHGWKHVLFDGSDHEENKENAWKSKYPQWMLHRTKQADTNDDSELADANLVQFVSSPNAPYNQDNDHTKMYHSNSESDSKTIGKQTAFHLKRSDLDPLQRHFLSRANHSRLESFVNGLSGQQHSFLNWLIFCYYHKVECRARRHFPKGFNDSFHFGYDFQWHEISGWPQLIEHTAKSEALQLQIDRVESRAQQALLLSDIDDDDNHSLKNVQSALSKIEQILQDKNSIPLIVGIELSAAHLSKQQRYQIDCDLYTLIKHVMFWKDGGQPCFVRLTKLQDDIVVPYRPCAFSPHQ